ncbi:MAG: RNA-binding S4 domain-containing protein [Clostridia bacterium]|nr:RNA-binding S4 domain-containing protein [Clostridia bacterium]
MIKRANFKLKVKEKKVVEKTITTDFIRLDSFLKFCDVAQTGGHAKMIIQYGDAKVNGEVCTQRGKKLRTGDEVEFENVIYRLV